MIFCDANNGSPENQDGATGRNDAVAEGQRQSFFATSLVSNLGGGSDGKTNVGWAGGDIAGGGDTGGGGGGGEGRENAQLGGLPEKYVLKNSAPSKEPSVNNQKV